MSSMLVTKGTLHLHHR